MNDRLTFITSLKEGDKVRLHFNGVEPDEWISEDMEHLNGQVVTLQQEYPNDSDWFFIDKTGYIYSRYWMYPEGV